MSEDNYAEMGHDLKSVRTWHNWHGLTVKLVRYACQLVPRLTMTFEREWLRYAIVAR